MATRTVIEIDEEKCDGCGLCATGCHEGALQIIDGKARLVGESLCDGLGACIGECPRGALTTIEREVEAYDERRVIEHILPMGMATRLEQWPVQLHLINPRAPYFQGADLLIAADCTAYACGAFHQVLLAGRRLIIACPKLDTGKEVYIDKIRALVRDSGVASITIAIMDVPCCGGLKRLVNEALAGIQHSVPIATVAVSAKGGTLTWL